MLSDDAGVSSEDASDSAFSERVAPPPRLLITEEVIVSLISSEKSLFTSFLRPKFKCPKCDQKKIYFFDPRPITFSLLHIFIPLSCVQQVSFVILFDLLQSVYCEYNTRKIIILLSELHFELVTSSKKENKNKNEATGILRVKIIKKNIFFFYELFLLFLLFFSIFSIIFIYKMTTSILFRFYNSLANFNT